MTGAEVGAGVVLGGMAIYLFKKFTGKPGKGKNKKGQKP